MQIHALTRTFIITLFHTWHKRATVCYGCDVKLMIGVANSSWVSSIVLYRPAYGGQPCLGQRQEHRLCNTHECGQEQDDPCYTEIDQIRRFYPDESYVWTATSAGKTVCFLGNKWAFNLVASLHMCHLFFIEVIFSWGQPTCQIFCTNDHDSNLFHLSSTVEDGTRCLTEGNSWEGACVDSECIQVGGLRVSNFTTT